MRVPLHLVNGDSARGAVTEATNIAQVIACRDVLSVGPVRSDLPPQRLSALRNDFWRSVFGDRPLPHSTRLSLVLDRCREAAFDGGLIIWAGAAASDQCMLSWILHALCDDRERASVLLVDLAAGGNGVRGPAELPPAALAACAAPEAVREQTWQAYAEAWRALTEPTPESWPGIARKRRTPAALAAALAIMVLRLPDRQRGLPRLDEKLLAGLGGGPATRPDVVRHALRTGEAAWRDIDNDAVGDLYLEWRLDRMLCEGLKQPLVTGAGKRLTLTDFGCDVLAGRANAVAVNGIEDDIGGVSLGAGSRLWFRDDGRVIEGASP